MLGMFLTGTFLLLCYLGVCALLVATFWPRDDR